jgi:hypothetical protein
MNNERELPSTMQCSITPAVLCHIFSDSRLFAIE